MQTPHELMVWILLVSNLAASQEVTKRKQMIGGQRHDQKTPVRRRQQTFNYQGVSPLECMAENRTAHL
jgi:hypothetical protein